MEPVTWPLVGREAACEVIAGVLDRRPARSLVIAGPPGVGRSRLAREALAMAKARGRPVLWASATRTAAQVPLGALAHLLPPLDAAEDDLAMLQRTIKRISGDGSGPSPVLGVDDVHLLDPLSVTLLHQLAATEALTLVLTVRTGDAGPDPATALWKDGMATRLELGPLPRRHLESLATQVLGGDVDTRTAQRWWQLSLGNPLFFKEVLEEGLRTGQLHDADGLWRWEGRIVPSQRLVEVVLAQLGPLDAGEWRALEVLAAAEPLGVDQLAEFSSTEAVTALERRGLLVDEPGRPGDVRAAHPMYSLVVRTRLPEAALRRIRRELTNRYPAPPPREQLPRWCALVLDGDGAPPVPLLVAAARQAAGAMDFALAERLAQAALERGAGTDASLALIEATFWQGQPAVSERMALRAKAGAGTEGERACVAVAHALVLFCGLGRQREATSLLRSIADGPTTEDSRAVLQAGEAMLAFLGGRAGEAARVAASALDLGERVPAAQALAAAAAACALAAMGRTTDALDAVRLGRLALDRIPDSVQPSFARVALVHGEVTALHVAARLHELDERVAELARGNLAAHEWAGDAAVALYQGWSALAGGRPAMAIRALTEARVGFDRWDPVGLGPLCTILLAMSRALFRDVDVAHELLEEVTGRRFRPHPAFESYVVIARSWVAATDGRTAEAVELSLAAARLAAEQGQWAVEGMALYGAVRLGRAPELVDRLRSLSDRLDARLIDYYAAHAQAIVTGSGEELEQISRSFQHAGALLAATDTAAESAAAYERQGNRREAASAGARATALARASGLPQRPTMEALPLPGLTVREEEVARLAAQGLSNQAIAARLVLSIRTVEAHLAHAYAKLGITGRADLARSLQVPAQQQRTPTASFAEPPRP